MHANSKLLRCPWLTLCFEAMTPVAGINYFIVFNSGVSLIQCFIGIFAWLGWPSSQLGWKRWTHSGVVFTNPVSLFDQFWVFWVRFLPRSRMSSIVIGLLKVLLLSICLGTAWLHCPANSPWLSFVGMKIITSRAICKVVTVSVQWLGMSSVSCLREKQYLWLIQPTKLQTLKWLRAIALSAQFCFCEPRGCPSHQFLEKFGNDCWLGTPVTTENGR